MEKLIETTTKPVIVALDFPTEQEAWQCLSKFNEDTSVYVKVGMELYYSAGPNFVRELKQRGFNVFVDLKLHDIPNTVKSASRVLTKLGADIFNVHVAGGKAMMQAAVVGMIEGLQEGQRKPLLIGVTHLTSTSEQTLQEEIGIDLPIHEAVIRYAVLAKESGLDGVVCSPLEVPLIKEACGDSFITVTPGIRPVGADKGDQERITTPEQARELKTDYIVVGRPITKSDNPKQSYDNILKAFTSK